jgi:hypothetical protein
MQSGPKEEMFMQLRRSFYGRNRYRLITSIALFAFIGFLTPCFIWGQESRTDELVSEKNAKETKKYEPNAGEIWINRLERWGFMTEPNGIYPWFGNVYSGGGAAGGAGFHKLFGDTASFDVHGGYSIAGYKLVETNFHLPELADQRIKIDVNGSYIDATQVKFFGIGNDSLEGDKTNFGYQPTSGRVTGTIQPVQWLAFGGGFEYLDISTSEGSGSSPSTEEKYDSSTAPGLGLDLTYNVYRGFTTIDTRPARGWYSEGVLVEFNYAKYEESDDNPFSFEKMDVVASAWIPLLRSNWIIHPVAYLLTTNTDGNNEVPYYMLPSIGGGYRVRGFVDYRYQDRNAMAFTLEYIWTPSHFVDMALFYDIGRVASKKSDLDFKNLKDSYGIGFRIHARQSAVFRFDAAFSDENKPRIVLSFGRTY